MKILVLGLGNELLGDDAVGLWAIRGLRPLSSGPVDIVESALSGLALLDHFIGYDRAIIVDAMCSASHPPGTILELAPADFDAVLAPSPHFAGLPEMLALARQLKLEFPSEIKVFAVAIKDRGVIGEGLSPSIKRGLPQLVRRVCKQVRRWNQAP